MELYPSRVQSWLSWFLRGVLVLAFFILISRLFELQIIKGEYYRELSNSNRIRKIVLPAPRGSILARGGEILVGVRPIKKRIVFKSEGGYELSNDVGSAPLDEKITFYQRYYPLASQFAHAGGYLGEVSEKEVGKVDPKCPEKGERHLGDLIGRGGLEEEYNCSLSGKSGEELVEVDIRGRLVRILGKVDPIPGIDLKTNIDFGLQIKVAETLGDKKGGVIITDPLGQVLAFYSSPSYDPNLFVTAGDSEKISEVLNDPNLPLFNRIIGGEFHPGSVFKPTIAIAGLEEKKIDKNFKFNDPGVIKIDKYAYSNWFFSQYGKTEGEIGIIRAIARSTDTFFYKLGEIVGIDKLVSYAEKFGYTQKTGIDIPGEISGLIPSPEWKKRVKNEAWFLGNTYHFSIGQGDVAVTPIEVNRAISVIASGGEFCRPAIFGKPKCESLGFKKENLDLVKEGMEETCSSGGTGYTFFDFSSKYSGKKVACKTGTAETNVDGKTHAWFTVIAPSDFPEVVATVLVERGGEGASVAGPIARGIIDYWMTRNSL